MEGPLFNDAYGPTRSGATRLGISVGGTCPEDSEKAGGGICKGGLG